MYNRTGPYITSLESGFEDLERPIPLSNLSKPMFEITEMIDGDPFVTVELNRESRQYIHVRVRHITKTYDEEGNMNITNKYYPLKKCSEEFMNKTEFERKFYEQNKGSNSYCMDDPEIMLRGTRDS